MDTKVEVAQTQGNSIEDVKDSLKPQAVSKINEKLTYHITNVQTTPKQVKFTLISPGEPKPIGDVYVRPIDKGLSYSVDKSTLNADNVDEVIRSICAVAVAAAKPGVRFTTHRSDVQEAVTKAIHELYYSSDPTDWAKAETLLVNGNKIKKPFVRAIESHR
jgi:hypothetical protein